MPSAVEEFLRFVTPVTHMCRTALDDVELRGQQIRRGDFLCLLYAVGEPRRGRSGSAATSSTCGATPDPPQIAFGFAEHFCLGREPGAARRSRIVADRAAGAVPQLRAGRRRRTARNSHMTPGVKRMPVGLPPLTRSRQATTPLTLRSMTVSQSRPRCPVRIWSPCSLKSGDLPGTDGSSSNCTGVSTSL